MKITEERVAEAICPRGKVVLLFDSETRGFGLRVTADGSKVFLAQYAVAGSKRRIALGQFGVLTVKQARKEAKGILGLAACRTSRKRCRRRAG